MQDLKNIKKFIFGYAQYHLSDEMGDEIILKIDYKNSRYSIKENGKVFHVDFRQEVDRVAKDLLSRKHGVNFAKKVI